MEAALLKQSDTEDSEQPSADSEVYGGEYTEAQEINRLRRIRHESPTIDRIPAHVKQSLEDNPYDVFLLHAGEQKMNVVATMTDYFEDGGLRYFMDRGMTPRRTATTSMRFALTTCRYAVVVLSREFFTKRHPASKLMYAFQRMQWIRQQDHLQGWNSLIVVLYNMTVQEYKDRPRVDGVELPESLCADQVLIEWSNRGKIPWHVECLKMREMMLKQDNDGTLNKWLQFLEQCSSETLASDFPSADALYSDETSEQRTLVNGSSESSRDCFCVIT